jgi:hypothetical protein
MGGEPRSQMRNKMLYSSNQAEWFLLFVLLFIFRCSMAAKASLTYMPKGSNPLLYTPGVDPIVHLDQDTFEDTVFDPANTNAYFVEYYADW